MNMAFTKSEFIKKRLRVPDGIPSRFSLNRKKLEKLISVRKELSERMIADSY